MSARPLAVVLGDIDLVRPLGMAGISSATFALPTDPVQWSRHVRARLPWVDPWTSPDGVLDALLTFAAAQPCRPVLMPQRDPELLIVARHRERLAKAFRFLVADPDLVETLTDKVRFSELAERLGLPVPRTQHLRPAHGRPGDVDLRFPLVIKPAHRWREKWAPVGREAKARHVPSPAALAELWPTLADLDLEVLAQEAVPGPETLIESHHAYVDADGRLVADFTGRKIRTRPAQYGHSTALEITSQPDVAALGREVLERVGLRGMAKADFKRAPDGSLKLLEINARSTLWHHPAARAGVNLPALMYADLTGGARPAVGAVRPGVRWCSVRDARAALGAGGSVRGWVRWAAGVEAFSELAWDDPMPFLGGTLLGTARQRLPGRRRLGRPKPG